MSVTKALREGIKDLVRQRDAAITNDTPGAAVVVHEIASVLGDGLRMGTELWHAAQALNTDAILRTGGEDAIGEDRPRVSRKFASSVIVTVKTSLPDAHDCVRGVAWVRCMLNARCLLACLELLTQQSQHMETYFFPGALLRSRGSQNWDEFVSVITPVAGPPLDARELVGSDPIASLVEFALELTDKSDAALLEAVKATEERRQAATRERATSMLSGDPATPVTGVPPKNMPQVVVSTTKSVASSPGKRRVKTVKKVIVKKKRVVRRGGEDGSDTQSLASTMVSAYDEQEQSLLGEEVDDGLPNSGQSTGSNNDDAQSLSTVVTPLSAQKTQSSSPTTEAGLLLPPSAASVRSDDAKSEAGSASAASECPPPKPPIKTLNLHHSVLAKSPLRREGKVYRMPNLQHPAAPLPKGTTKLREEISGAIASLAAAGITLSPPTGDGQPPDELTSPKVVGTAASVRYIDGALNKLEALLAARETTLDRHENDLRRDELWSDDLLLASNGNEAEEAAGSVDTEPEEGNDSPGTESTSGDEAAGSPPLVES